MKDRREGQLPFWPDNQNDRNTAEDMKTILGRTDNLLKMLCGCLLFFTAIAIPAGPLWAEDAVAVSPDGVNIVYSVQGQGEPTLVFVHGWCCDRSFWREQVLYFSKTHRVVTLDLAGHGRSGKERSVYSLAAFGKDVAAVVRAVGNPNVILLGHSMGGAVILKAAETLPGQVLALVGIDTMQDFEEEFTKEQAEDFLKPFRQDFRAATDAFVRGMFVPGTDPRLVEEIAAKMSGASPAVGLSALESMLSRSYKADPPRITVPVWCLNADLWPTKAEVNRRYVPEFNLKIMPGLGHFLMLESPAEFNRQLDDIIAQIGKSQTRQGTTQ